jgi:hypothetical protein
MTGTDATVIQYCTSTVSILFASLPWLQWLLHIFEQYLYHFRFLK